MASGGFSGGGGSRSSGGFSGRSSGGGSYGSDSGSFMIAWLVIRLIELAVRAAAAYHAERRLELPGKRLPRTKSGKKRLIRDFSEKYKLYLTEEQIRQIEIASRTDGMWQKELYDMMENYATVDDWIKGDTAWLRAYLAAFVVQDIRYNIELQQKVADAAFAEVLGFSAQYHDLWPGEECDIINQKYFTLFTPHSLEVAKTFLSRREH